MTSRSVTTLAPAKINLVLRILHRRPDGFREVETVFQTISVADSVTVTVGEGGGEGMAGENRLSLRVEGADVGPERENLAWRAAEHFVRRCAPGLTVNIRLIKRIPAGAGLGGGSSDAAAVLRCLATLTDFTDDDTLHGIAAELGSDVPFFLTRTGMALGRGRGEELEPLPPLPSRAVVLALPPVHVSTAEAYRALGVSRASPTDGTELDPHGGRRDLPASELSTWATLDGLAENDFEAIVAAQHGVVRRSLEGLRQVGADVALLSGSGAACFGLFDSDTSARSAATDLSAATGWPFVHCTTLASLPPVEHLHEG